MNKKNCFLGSFLMSFFLMTPARAERYECFVPANPDRGFNFDFTISINPATAGGQIVMKVAGQQKKIGVVSEASSLRRGNPQHIEAFNATLGYIGEEDVSGVPEGALGQVETIEVFMAETMDGDEAFVYKLFDASQQVGGTFLLSGMGTACIP